MRALALASMLFVASACTPRPGALPSTPDSTPPSASSTTASPATSLGDEGCTRPDATPALDASKAKDHSFTRGLGPRAEERATLADGTAVTVLHLGCEHFVERYTFRLAKGATPSAARAKELLASLPVAADHAARVSEWTAALSNASGVAMDTAVDLPAGGSLTLRSKEPGELSVTYDASR